MAQVWAHISIVPLYIQVTCFNSISNFKKSGKYIQFGLKTGNHKLPNVPMDKVFAIELELIGSHGIQSHNYPEMLELINIFFMKNS